MKLTHGYPFWLINDGLPFHYKKLVQNISADVTIIGGGISGALAAYCLTQAGIPCVLVDGRTIGLGSTCASTSLLQYELDTPLHKLIEQIGKQKAVRAYQLCGEAIGKIKCISTEIDFKEYEERQSLFFSTHSNEKKFIEKEFEARKNAGFELSLLNTQELFKTFGIKANYGILSKLGATINAYAFTHQLLQYSINKGLKVFDRTFITDIKYNTTGNVLFTKEGCKINSRYIVNASGYEVVNFISKKIQEFYCTYAIASEHQAEEISLWRDSIVLWNTDDPYLYCRLTKDNRLFAGGRDERFSNSVTREAFLEKKARLLEKDFEKICPQINFKTEFTWCGTFAKTKDALPYIGVNPETPNTFYALGFGGNGITFSMLAAEIITALIQGKKHDDAALFSFNR